MTELEKTGVTKKKGFAFKDLDLLKLKDKARKGNTVAPTNPFEEFKQEALQQDIGARFQRQVGAFPHKTAVVSGNSHLTYGALDRRANRAARAILAGYDDSRRLGPDERTRYSRQMMLHQWGTEAQETLKGTTAFAAGAGGSGSPLLMQLALAGFGTVIVCDRDDVELSNLNRQVLHDASRIGMNKAESAKLTLQRINPHVKVITHGAVTRENIHELAAGADVIFDNVDDLETKFVLSEYAVARGIPHVISSMIDMNAYAAVFHPPHTPCYHCLHDRGVLEDVETLKRLTPGYRKMPNPVASPALFLSTGFAVNEVVKILLGFDHIAYNRYFFFNQRPTAALDHTDGYRLITFPFSEHFKTECREQGFDWDTGWRGRFLEELTITRDPGCPVCGGAGAVNIPGLDDEKEKEPAVPPAATGPAPPCTVEDPRTVALLFGQGQEMIAGLLGALKSGMAYVPLDPGYPPERLEYMLEDSGARLIVTCGEYVPLAARLRDRVNRRIRVVDTGALSPSIPDTPPELHLSPDHSAYILYTSGSTGKAKGVIQNHRNVLHFARVYTNALHICKEDRLTLFSSYSFDAAKMDIFGALLNGATLYPYDIKADEGLTRMPLWLERNRITIFHSIPTVYRYFTGLLEQEEGGNGRYKGFKHLRFIVLGGEAVFKKDIEAYKAYFPDHCIFINGLGPTESTVTLQYFIGKHTPVSREAVPVGYPVAETSVLLLDDNDREAVGGGVGEIVYVSDYLALGYFNLPGKSREVFTVNPVGGKGRVYRSGDLGRRLPDGSIEYAGRKDFQVKVRGYRIELGEIESRMDRLPGIEKSVVVCRSREGGENYLTAYYTAASPGTVDEEGVVRQLKELLPDYMIPGILLEIETFPHTPTGKIDRKALAQMDTAEVMPETGYVPPEPGPEAQLAELWQELLKVERVGALDNFFVLGGHSLKAIMLTSRIHQTFDIKVPLEEIFQRPTVRQLARWMTGAQKTGYVGIPPLEEKEYYPLSYQQGRLWLLHRLNPETTAYHMPGFFPLRHEVEPGWVESALAAVFQKHASLRTYFIEIGGGPMQRVAETVPVPLDVADASGLTPEEKEARREQLVQDLILKPFDLSTPPLFRAALVKWEPGHWDLIYNIHHIVSDGWSQEILGRDFLRFYGVVRGGGRPEVERPELRYKDYTGWHNRLIREPRFKRDTLDYWKKKLENGVPEFRLPYDFDGGGGTARAYRAVVDASVREGLRHLALDSRTTLFTVMFTAYNLLMYHFTGQREIVAGIISAGREQAELRDMVGYFTGSLISMVSVDADEEFGEFLARMDGELRTLFQCQAYPLELVLDELKLPYPGVSVAFNLHNMQDATADIELETGRPGTPQTGEAGQAKFDLILHVMEYKNALQLNWVYKEGLFSPATVERLAGGYLQVLKAVSESGIQKEKELK